MSKKTLAPKSWKGCVNSIAASTASDDCAQCDDDPREDGLTQAHFAKLLGVSVRTLQDWNKAGEHLRSGTHAAIDRREESAGVAEVARP